MNPLTSLPKAICLVVLLTVSGCSVLSSRPESVVEPVAAPAPLSSGSASNLPLKVEVVDELNDGKTLYVLTRVSAKQPWPARNVALKLRALSDGEEVRSSLYRLNSQAGENGMLSEKEPIEAALEIPSEGISDYQVELSWNDTKAVGSKETVELTEVTTQRQPAGCEAEGCFEQLSVSAQMLNSTSSLINRVKLGVSFEFHPEAIGAEIRRGKEEEIALSNLGLAPGAQRSFNIALNAKIPVLSTGLFKPVVRVVSYE